MFKLFKPALKCLECVQKRRATGGKKREEKEKQIFLLVSLLPSLLLSLLHSPPPFSIASSPVYGGDAWVVSFTAVT